LVSVPSSNLRLKRLMTPCYSSKHRFCSQPRMCFNGRRCVQQWTFLIISLLVLSFVFSHCLEVQAQQLNERKLFEEDMKEFQDLRRKEKEKLLQPDLVDKGEEEISVVAPEITFRRESKEVVAKGGVVVSRGAVHAEAREAVVNLETNEAELVGDVVVSQSEGVFSADSAFVNVDYETGTFNNATFIFDPASVSLQAGKAVKYSETEYRLYDVGVSTCDCEEDGSNPWSIHSDEMDITEEGYAHTYYSTFRVRGVPVFYTPYFGFPVKRKRASGLLVPMYGLSNQDGVRLRAPVFVVLDESTDVLATPFVETRTRVGSLFQFRKSFSARNNVRTKFTYSNEERRGDSLRGLVTPGGVIPQIDENRLGVFHSHVWRSDKDAEVPIDFISDIHYTGDDSLVRELPDDELAIPTARFTTSRVLGRVGLGSYMRGEVLSEYNQVLDGDVEASDDTVLHRLPEASLNGSRSFRPFGSNLLGVKFVGKGAATYTRFYREQGVQGNRVNLNPSVQMPLRYKNYFNSTLDLRGYSTYYALDEIDQVSTLSDSSDRQTYIAQYTASTGVERVFHFDPDGFLARALSLGSQNQLYRLQRAKHVVEPFVSYLYVPNVAQDNLPLFDSTDRIRQRSVVTYGLANTIYGRFLPGVEAQFPITEMAPQPGLLPQFGPLEGVPQYSLGNEQGALGGVSTGRRGELRQLMRFVVRQSYDYIEDHQSQDMLRNSFSDVGFDLSFSPSTFFVYGMDGNYNSQRDDFSSWSNSLVFRDDRDDKLRVRYTFINPLAVQDNLVFETANISNLELGGELTVTDRIRLGYFSRYDETATDFIEQAGALRYYSSCNCWHVDVGVSERTNPDRQQLNFRFTFTGLGAVTQDLLRRQNNQQLQQ
jgi:lipopolysaccharide assembly outer membrane protein LptD (OstA)